MFTCGTRILQRQSWKCCVAEKLAQVFRYRYLSRNIYQFSKMAAKLHSLNFDNRALRLLPVDPVLENETRTVPNACFSRVDPTQVAQPQFVAVSKSAVGLLDLDESDLEHEDAVQYFSGNKLLPGSETASHCYCGYQFGSFSGQLGDGAAIYLGEVINAKGERWEIQLKGAGMTPYSRHADGRKVLRSSIREFLCSEAMFHLRIPTTRAGTCVTSESKVIRDVFYNGNPSMEKCTIISRIAPTFLRFGSFEIFTPTDPITGRKGPSFGRNDILVQMLNYTIQTFFPEIYDNHKDNPTEQYLEFYKQVILLTAKLVAKWQCVGFCHGVLNTDNMSILGLTIDYGPFGFMDSYNSSHICNGSDEGGRYAYNKQPEICYWNLKKFGEAIQGALPLSESRPLLDLYEPEFQTHYMESMRKKLGLSIEHSSDKELVESFLSSMEVTGADFTNSFRALSQLQLPGCKNFEESKKLVLTSLISQCASLEELQKQYAPVMDPRQFAMIMSMLQTNPVLAEMLGGRRGFSTIERELERLQKTEELKKLTPEQKKATDHEIWFGWIVKYISRLELEVQNHTGSVDVLNASRTSIMNSHNPKFVLRNYIAQNAIEAAENGDYTEVKRVLKVLETPYSDSVDLSDLEPNLPESVDNAESGLPSEDSFCQLEMFSQRYNQKPPDWSRDLRVT